MPFAAQSREDPEPYSLPGEDHQRRAGGRVALRGVVDAGDLAALGEVAGEAALGDVIGLGAELVPQADVGEGAADHHLVVAAARPVGVEVAARHAVLLQVRPRRRVGLDRARRADVVGGHRVAEQGEDAGALDVADRLGVGRHALEVRRLADVGRARVPVEGVAGRGGQALPALVAAEDVGVVAAEHLRADRGVDDLLDLLAGRPDVVEEHVLAVGVGAQRLGRDVDVHRAGQRVGDDQRR